jgi:RimJ/RimL family protein N-acetyltransferase
MTAAFATARLHARLWSPETDAQAAYALYSRPEIADALGWVPAPVSSPEQVRDYLAAWARPFDHPAYGVWAVQPSSGGAPIGTAFVRPLPPDEVDVEIGWHLHPEAWGRGYAAEIGLAAAEHAFAHGVAEVYAVIRPGSEHSAAVARRLCMQYVGRTAKYYRTELDVFRLRPADLHPVDGRNDAPGEGRT